MTAVDPKTVKIATKAPNVFLAAIEIMADEDIAELRAMSTRVRPGSARTNGIGRLCIRRLDARQPDRAQAECRLVGQIPRQTLDRVIDRFVADGANPAGCADPPVSHSSSVLAIPHTWCTFLMGRAR